jgi:hypothetical protein
VWASASKGSARVTFRMPRGAPQARLLARYFVGHPCRNARQRGPLGRYPADYP